MTDWVGLRAIAGASPVPMVGVDGASHIVRYVNAAFCGLAGKSSEELIGSAFAEVVPASDECLSLLERVYQTGQPETHIGSEQSDSRPFYWSYCMWPMLRPSDGILIQVTETTPFHRQASAMNQELLLGSVRQHELTDASDTLNVQLQGEIGERKRVETALRESEGQLRMLISASPVAILVIDADARVRLWNASAERLFGWTEAEVLGRVVPFVPDDRRQEFIVCRDTALRGEVFAVRTQRQKRDGSIVEVSLTAAPLGKDGGEAEEILLLLEEIGERKRAEDALAASEYRFRFMAESMPQKIFTARPDGSVDYFNRQWMEFTGLAFDQIRDWGWRQFIHPDDLEETVRQWRHSVDTGEPFRYVHRFLRADGAYRWHLSRSQAMRGADGKVSMWIGSNTEIHDEKEKEEELRRANEDLNQFAFAASHDFQEPLRTITSYSQLLIQGYSGQLGGDAAVYVDFITRGARTMRNLLMDLLAYTETGANRKDSAEEIDLNLTMKTVALNLKAAIEESGAIITWDPLPTVRGQETRFVQLFQNLIGNAIKYRGERTPRIHVAVERQPGEWRFAVADNGIGIAPEYHRQIFGVFKRLHGNTIPGTGIGLAICQRIVERYGGRIWVESEADRGAAFCFTLPMPPGLAGERLTPRVHDA